jgi:hypothetical protein
MAVMLVQTEAVAVAVKVIALVEAVTVVLVA